MSLYKNITGDFDGLFEEAMRLGVLVSSKRPPEDNEDHTTTVLEVSPRFSRQLKRVYYNPDKTEIGGNLIDNVTNYGSRVSLFHLYDQPEIYRSHRQRITVDYSSSVGEINEIRVSLPDNVIKIDNNFDPKPVSGLYGFLLIDEVQSSGRVTTEKSLVPLQNTVVQCRANPNPQAKNFRVEVVGTVLDNYPFAMELAQGLPLNAEGISEYCRNQIEVALGFPGLLEGYKEKKK